MAARAPDRPVSVSTEGNRVRIAFPEDVTELPETAVPALAKLVERLKRNKDLRIQLIGYAGGGVGSPSQARRLSLFRALSVRTHLMKQGIRSTRMDVRALGNKVDDGPPNRVDIVVQQ